MVSWISWESNCRGRKYSKECLSTLPDTVTPRSVVAYYNSSLKKLLTKASIDLAPTWLIPPRILRYIERFYRELLSRLENAKTNVSDELARLIMYPIYICMLEVIARGLKLVSEEQGSPYVQVTSSYIFTGTWSIPFMSLL
ncbi:MAG: hypothetical protein ABWW69_05580 [Pyrodictiaceae archaeon]